MVDRFQTPWIVYGLLVRGMVCIQIREREEGVEGEESDEDILILIGFWGNIDSWTQAVQGDK